MEALIDVFLHPSHWVALFTGPQGPEHLTTLFTLSTLEVILGIDNLVMIAILVSDLPHDKQNMGRRLGIGFALLTRTILLCMMSWLASLITPLFHIAGHPVSVRDLVMIIGGLFLLYKGAKELYETAMEADQEGSPENKSKSLIGTVAMIGVFDIVFSLDSVITAVGLSKELPIMVTAICLAMAVMLFASGPVIMVIEKFDSIKIMALSFIVLIGVMLLCNGVNHPMPKSLVYTCMAYAAFVEIVAIAMKTAKPAFRKDKYFHFKVMIGCLVIYIPFMIFLIMRQPPIGPVDPNYHGMGRLMYYYIPVGALFSAFAELLVAKIHSYQEHHPEHHHPHPDANA